MRACAGMCLVYRYTGLHESVCRACAWRVRACEGMSGHVFSGKNTSAVYSEQTVSIFKFILIGEKVKSFQKTF